MTPKLTQLFVLVAIIAGFVVLSVRGTNTGEYIAVVTPILGTVFVASRLESRSDTQDQALAKITDQTNGVLTKRIQDAVHSVLDAREQNPPGA